MVNIIRGSGFITPDSITWIGQLPKGRPRGKDEKAEETRKDKLRKLAKQVRKEFKPRKLSRKELAYEVGKRCGLSGATIKRHYNEILDE